MRKYRIELGKMGDEKWKATFEKNHGTEDAPEWWGEGTVEGDLKFVLNSIKREVHLQERKEQDGS